MKIINWIKSNFKWDSDKNKGFSFNALLSVLLLLGFGLTQVGAAIAGVLIVLGIKWLVYLIKSNKELSNTSLDSNVQFSIGAALWFAYFLLI